MTIKKLIGWITLLNILPLFCLFCWANVSTEDSFWAWYCAGWLFNVVIGGAFLILAFVFWCFKD